MPAEIILFIFGLMIGSFLNVVSLRYDGERVVADPNVIGGRSHCPHCGETLHWYELIPVVSFIIQNRKCRHCGARIGWQYPIVELLSACIFTFVPIVTYMLTGPGEPLIVVSTLWVVVFEILLLIACIDLRLGIIPDELSFALGVLGIFFITTLGGYFGPANHSLFGSYAGFFGLQENILLNHLAAAVIACLFFFILVVATRGKGMGMGDVKLAFPLGLIFGWPDIMVLVAGAFIIGAVVGIALIVRGKKNMKGTLPFAPFLAIGAAIVFFGSYAVTSGYLHIGGL